MLRTAVCGLFVHVLFLLEQTMHPCCPRLDLQPKLLLCLRMGKAQRLWRVYGEKCSATHINNDLYIPHSKSGRSEGKEGTAG